MGRLPTDECHLVLDRVIPSNLQKGNPQHITKWREEIRSSGFKKRRWLCHSLLGSVCGQILLVFLSNSRDCLSNLTQTYAVNEKRLWLRKVHPMEDFLWGKYQYDSLIWLMSVLGKNKVPNGDLTEEELGGRINSFLCSVGRFFWAQRPRQCVGECVYSTYTYTEVFSYFCWYFVWF